MAKRFTSQRVNLHGELVTVDLPLLDRLHELDETFMRGFPAESRFDYGLGRLGLLLTDELKPLFYDRIAPRNGLAIGTTGGNGVHFNLLVSENRVDVQSPVVVTVPGARDRLLGNIFVGENLEDFVRYGLIRGFFAMEQFAYKREVAIAAFGSAEWQATEKWHHSVGFARDADDIAIAEYISKQLGLAPLTRTPEDFAALQERHRSKLVFDEITVP